jgi:hypothetical protein
VVCGIIPPLPREGGGYTVLRLSILPSVLPSIQDIFCRIFLSNCRWQKSDIWSQASYRYAILWIAFLDPSDSYFLFADFVDFNTHWTYILLIFRRIFLSKYWWQKSDISSQASYRYPILWEAFFDPSDSYFLFADLVGFYTHWTYMRGVYKIQLSRQTGSRNLTGPKTLPTIWHTYMKLVTKYQISVIDSCWEKCDKKYLGRTEGRTDRGKTVYPHPPPGSGGIVTTEQIQEPIWA